MRTTRSIERRHGPQIAARKATVATPCVTSSGRPAANAATVVCKQIIGGIEPRILTGDNRIDHGNNRVIVLAAQKFVCDR